MGPLVSDRARTRVTRGVGQAVRDGAERLIGGQSYQDAPLTSGWYYPPTLLRVTDTDLPVWREELFGPVLTMVTADSVAHAFSLANDSEFGLSAAVFTNDLAIVEEAMREIDVGVLHINSETAGADPHVPFGGVKGSGFGPMEQGRAAREFLTRTRTTYIRAASDGSQANLSLPVQSQGRAGS
jgi:alpha-ketoglutaric semialdehyde dehydrogenase